MEKSKRSTLEEFWPFQKFFKTDIIITDQERDQIKFMLYNFKNLSKDPCNTTTYGQQVDILNLPVLNNLKQQILNILNSFNLKMSNNWGQLYKKGQHMQPHTHTMSVYSGIIYVDGKSTSGTYFVNSLNGDIYEHPFTKNELLMFPSNVIHYVPHETEDNGRMIISFNTVEKF